MRIGIVDDLFLSLQNKLLSEGHELFVMVPGGPAISHISPEHFNVCLTKGGITPIDSLEGLINKKCDLYIVGTDGTGIYEILTALNFNVVGHSTAAIQLEMNREFAFQIIKNYNVRMVLPECFEIYTIAEAKKFIKSTKKTWVWKQTSQSPLDNYLNRTIIAKNPEQCLKLLDQDNAWFKDGKGGIRFEEFKSGYEVSFGAWFDGDKFLKPMYYNFEHKGAQNNNRGEILTGEVGTVHIWEHNLNTTYFNDFLLPLEPFLKGKCNGFVDINSIYDPITKSFTFIEFTIRYGRPTLEVMLAMQTCGTNYGNLLYAITTKQKNAQKNWAKSVGNEIAVGVTVFTYGYPVLDQVIEALPENKRAEFYNKIAFTMPKANDKSSKIMQLWATYSHSKKCWYTSNQGRQFVAVGLSTNIDKAIENAYSPLDNFSLLGHTWRDDIGKNVEEILRSL